MRTGSPSSSRTSKAFIKHTLSQKYNGESNPRSCSSRPSPHEDLTKPIVPNGVDVDPGNPNMSDGAANNARLAKCTEVMQLVANANGVLFVDLFNRGYESLEPHHHQRHPPQRNRQ